MEDLFIQNKGTNKTIIHNSRIKDIKESDWDINYDGNKARMDMKINDNGFIQNYQLELDNNDLEDLLSIPSEPLSIDKRLKNDFFKKRNSTKFIIPKSKANFTYKKNKKLIKNKFKNKKSRKYTHLSSPNFKDEYFVPFTNHKSKKNNHSYPLFQLPKKKI
jgi:hypothetical protein